MMFNRKTMESETRKRRMAEAHLLLECANDFYWMQLEGGRYFPHEHPRGARD